MLKNAKSEYDTNPSKEGNDIRLTSKDQELVFEGGNDNEEVELSKNDVTMETVEIN